MTSTMRALVGGIGPNWDVLEVDVPTPGEGQILIRVHAAGLNRADLMMLDGSYSPASKTSSLYSAGLEMAGEVAAVGEGVTTLAVGDRIAGAGLGAFAEYVVLDAGHVLPMPASLDWIESAALPIGLATEYDALVTQGGLTAGQRVLVVGATSSVGLLAVQLAKSLGASLVAATTTSESKGATLSRAGADVVINTKVQQLAESVAAATLGEGADVVLDHVGGALFPEVLAATRINGTVVNIGRLGGQDATINLDVLAFRRLTVRGTTFSVRSPDEIAQVTAQVRTQVLPLLASGHIRPIIDRVFAFEDALAAADHMRSNQAVGKIILRIDDSSQRK
ncbi:alcohol dehydrogenase [Mycobacterium sp. MHSD3]|nr:zinc-binding dehydrogenase [Mycobacteroides chelonae]PKQ59372.1 alcohol dehydrogenase [Mycobacterium sp. MHSD3]